MGNRGDIPNAGNTEAARLEGADSCFTPTPWALHINFNLAQAMLHSSAGSTSGSQLGSIRGAFA